jgi:RND family efflux transporter MFP subunit
LKVKLKKEIMTKSDHINSGKGKVNRKKTILISIGILLAGVIITILIFNTEPKAVREGATKQTAMLVQTIPAERGNFRPVITATGVVRAEKDIMLSPLVDGEVIEVSQAFTPGGFVNEGDVLLRIDPADYRNELLLRESELHQQQASYDVEMGLQNVARKDYELFEDTLTGENLALVLREPQLKAAEARLEAAEAAVAQAKLNLERTVIKAPFDAHIIDRLTNLGSLVSTGEPLAQLVGIQTYWVEVSIPLSKIRWLSFPEAGQGKGSEVRIRNRAAWPDSLYRIGHIDKLIGTLESQTRMARVLVEVDDPLAHINPSEYKPPLMIGAFVEVRLEGIELTNVIRLGREFVRKDETVWVKKDGKLEIREVEILLTDRDYAYIKAGLEEGDEVVTTNLSTVREGAPLRLESEEIINDAGTEGGEQ